MPQKLCLIYTWLLQGNHVIKYFVSICLQHAFRITSFAWWYLSLFCCIVLYFEFIFVYCQIYLIHICNGHWNRPCYTWLYSLFCWWKCNDFNVKKRHEIYWFNFNSKIYAIENWQMHVFHPFSFSFPIKYLPCNKEDHW